MLISRIFVYTYNLGLQDLWRGEVFWIEISIHQTSCDGVVLEIYLGHEFQWQQEGLNNESVA